MTGIAGEAGPAFLERYLRDFAECGPDLFAPELQTCNTRRLNDLWKLCCEREDAMAAVPFWGIVWPGSRALARYILDSPETVRGLRILDLGCGSGLAAIAAARAGAQQVLGIDIDAMGPLLADHLARLNGLDSRACIFRDGDGLVLTDDELDGFDLVLAGDVFYEEDFAKRALVFLRRALDRGVRNLLADPGRTHRPQPGDERVNGLNVGEIAEYRVPVYPDIEGISKRTTTLLEISKAD